MDDAGRSKVVGALRAELFGPPEDDIVEGDPNGADTGPRRLDLSQTPVFATRNESYGPFVESLSGEEILTRARPTNRYGIGVLYPRGEIAVDVTTEDDEGTSGEGTSGSDPSSAELLGVSAGGFQPSTRGEADDDDFDLTATTQYRPSAMGVSCLLRLGEGDRIQVESRGGMYTLFKAKIEGAEREWWVRRPVSIRTTYAVPTGDGLMAAEDTVASEETKIEHQLLARQEPGNPDLWLVTVVAVNRAGATASADSESLFQAMLSVSVERNGQLVSAVQPYPDRKTNSVLATDQEARSLDLLYRKAPTFAIGHGCAATWSEGWGSTQASVVIGNPLPTFEAPSTTPDASLSDGTLLEVPIGPLAGLDPGNDGFDSVRSVIDGYDAWLGERREEAEALEGFRAAAASDHIVKCAQVLERMRAGLQWIESDPQAKRAFVLANRAVLYAQLRFSDKVREVKIGGTGVAEVDGRAPFRDWQEANFKWRAFQIAFIICAARSAVLPVDTDRETVELIFFPTGGGKTEAYQGLAAFSIFYQRLSGGGEGVNVILRYTLRLLTSQQFLRAASLVCAMEFIRTECPKPLCADPFSIGIWVGESTTPTRREQALRDFKKLRSGDGENPFLLLKCPWCSAQMGPVAVEAKAPRSTPKVAGYKESGGTVQFFCPDRQCHFRQRMPIYVIDQDIYERRPSIIVGTVDKFAMLAYRPEARCLFGLDSNGDRELDPPNLIIQDELHLISGPLGSVAGLYESVIESLCTDSRGPQDVKPKIVASTATIRRFELQVKGLYNRDDVTLFPPHGLDASDSFFARFARDRESGELLQGRLYVGIHAPGLGSMQTVQVRTSSALLQAAVDLPEDERDPWWTLMMFFNSIRELGTSVSLLQSDVVDYLLAMGMRSGRDLAGMRRINEIMELTSRMRQDEIPQAIQKLERSASAQYPVDACLASNIIEVGVDIQRLSVLMVVGQPKSTSQYIQVTGRVGRNWQERPGLIVALYGASKPRDRSHFERFQSYHQRLYAEVEPVSVTPFALPVLKRALHAVLLTYIRQRGSTSLGPNPLPVELFEEASRIVRQRAMDVDASEVGPLKRQLDQRLAEWEAWEPAEWLVDFNMSNDALFRRAGSWVPASIQQKTWSVPMSMRDVDAECRGEITSAFAIAAAGSDDESEEG